MQVFAIQENSKGIKLEVTISRHIRKIFHFLIKIEDALIAQTQNLKNHVPPHAPAITSERRKPHT